MKRAIGEQYTIRSYEEGDIAAIVKYANNHRIWQWLTNRFPHPYTETDARNWIQHAREQEIKTNFAIATEEELIGSIGFEFKNDIHCKTVEFGYWLGEPFWGQGIVSKAANAMTTYIFTQHDVVRIQAGVFEGNIRSARVLEKAGFTLEARLSQHVFKDGNILDEQLYVLLREEWQKQMENNFL